MPKNSTIPLILFGLIILSMPLFIHGQNSQGYNGPVLYTGIYRGQEGRFIPSISTEALQVQNTVSAVDQLVGHEDFQNFSQGLEGPYWSNLLIYAEDDHPVTRSTVKGMAEMLTGMLSEDVRGMKLPFYLVHVQLYNKTLRPWGVNRIIRISTEKADQHPQAAGDAFNSVVHIAIQDPRVPDLTRSLMPLCAGGVAELGMRIEHHSQKTDTKTDEDINWANWHASIGRSIAGDALRYYWNGSVEEMDWQMLDYDTEFGAWQAWKDRDEGKEQSFGEKTLLPVHPDHKNVSWYAGFQEPLARGWYASIVGTKRISKMGTERMTVAEWDKHISGSGSWQKQQTLHEDVLLWNAIAPDPNRLGSIITKQRSYGADVITWMTDPRVSALLKEWIAAAQGGDYQARTLLRRYLLSSHIEPELAQEALGVLRQQASLADQAIIGLHADATAEEKQIARAVAYVRGISDDDTAAQALDMNIEDITHWDKQPLLVKSQTHIGVLLFQRAIKEEQPVRIQVWFRALDPAQRAQRSEFSEGTVAIGDLLLQLETSADGYSVSFKK